MSSLAFDTRSRQGQGQLQLQRRPAAPHLLLALTLTLALAAGVRKPENDIEDLKIMFLGLLRIMLY